MYESSIIFFPCANMEQTEVFYTDIVGLKKVQEQAGGRCRIFDTGYGYLGFSLKEGFDACQNDGVCISFNCKSEEEVRERHAKLVLSGCEILSEPEKNKIFPVYSFFVRDINGYKLEFQYMYEKL